MAGEKRSSSISSESCSQYGMMMLLCLCFFPVACRLEVPHNRLVRARTVRCLVHAYYLHVCTPKLKPGEKYTRQPMAARDLRYARRKTATNCRVDEEVRLQ